MSSAHVELKRDTTKVLVKQVAILVWALAISNSIYAQTLRVVQGSHPLDEYAVGALRVALRQLPQQYQLEIEKNEFVQTRVIEEIKLKRLDVMWLASNIQAEETLLPVRFPLLKGLLGYRICIINPQSRSRFALVDDFSKLKALSFGQGYGWPDVNILESNDLKVVTTSKYENLFHMVEGGRFDGFPRGVLEPWVELKDHADLGLIVDPHLLLIYTLPFYFFVDPNNVELAQELQLGLDLALQNGDYDQYFFNHPMVAGALEKAKLSERKAFSLSNPSLSQNTPLERRDYWYKVENLDE